MTDKKKTEEKKTEEKKTEEKPKIKWMRSREGVFETYANQGHLTWSLDDVIIHFAQLGQSDESLGPGTNMVPINFEKAAITISWRGAKILRNQLDKIIKNHEAANGEIAIQMKLASNEGT